MRQYSGSSASVRFTLCKSAPKSNLRYASCSPCAEYRSTARPVTPCSASTVIVASTSPPQTSTSVDRASQALRSYMLAPPSFMFVTVPRAHLLCDESSDESAVPAGVADCTPGMTLTVTPCKSSCIDQTQ